MRRAATTCFALTLVSATLPLAAQADPRANAWQLLTANHSRQGLIFVDPEKGTYTLDSCSRTAFHFLPQGAIRLEPGAYTLFLLNYNPLRTKVEVSTRRLKDGTAADVFRVLGTLDVELPVLQETDGGLAYAGATLEADEVPDTTSNALPGHAGTLARKAWAALFQQAYRARTEVQFKVAKKRAEVLEPKGAQIVAALTAWKTQLDETVREIEAAAAPEGKKAPAPVKDLGLERERQDFMATLALLKGKAPAASTVTLEQKLDLGHFWQLRLEDDLRCLKAFVKATADLQKVLDPLTRDWFTCTDCPTPAWRVGTESMSEAMESELTVKTTGLRPEVTVAGKGLHTVAIRTHYSWVPEFGVAAFYTNWNQQVARLEVKPGGQVTVGSAPTNEKNTNLALTFNLVKTSTTTTRIAYPMFQFGVSNQKDSVGALFGFGFRFRYAALTVGAIYQRLKEVDPSALGTSVPAGTTGTDTFNRHRGRFQAYLAIQKTFALSF